MAPIKAHGAHKLSSNEVAALVDGLLEEDAQAASGVNGEAARPYKFGSDNLSVMGDYYGLRMINERFCRLARSVFLPFLRMHPRISSFPPEVKTFDHYCDELENFVSLTTARADALRSTQLIMLPPNFVSLLTNAYYGGNIAYLPAGRTEFTATEVRVIEIVTEGLHRALEAAWRDLFPVTFTAPVHEDNLQFAGFVDSQEKVVCCSFIIQLPDVDPATLDLIYPLQALKPIASRLRSRMQSDQVEDDMRWRARLAEAVMAVPLNVTAQLAQPTVPLSALSGLRPGRVVPVDLMPRPQLLIEGMPLFDGEPGEQGGRAALSLTRRVTP
ncbi:flagellar motor switch protein FliM [Roseovarius aquimarinus]|uniref:Flagellar motor switch protein FliM n=1 Tax=Roseovarius aquimarinus TaxID=1229156 RepID=A0ABW7I5C5_9RHOB